MFKQKAVFLDRDGTLIEAIHRPNFPENSFHKKEITAPFHENELVFVPDVHEVLDILRRMGFLTVMVTNQPDVAHGYMTEDEWQRIHNVVVKTLEFQHVYMCRHRSRDECDRKKPSPKMLFDAEDNLGINLSESYMIGDMDADMKASKAAGCAGILLERDYNQDVNADIRVASLTDAVKVIRLAEKMAE